MPTRLTTLIRLKNDIIRKINFTIIQLNRDFMSIINDNPEIVNYYCEHFDNLHGKYIYLNYPLIHLTLPPFKTSIECEQLIKAVNGNFDSENIRENLLLLFYNKIRNL